MLELYRATDSPAVKLISTRSLPAPVIYYDATQNTLAPRPRLQFITVRTTTDKGLAVFCCRTHFIGEDIVSIEVANNTLQN